jgi:hypothetical protein
MDRDGFYTNGDRYRGELRAGKKNGRGVYIWADGKVYSGEFADDEMDGYGVLEESGGVSYFGYWSGGRRDGPGLEMREGSLEFQRWEKGEEKESSPGGEILSPDYNWVYLSPQVKEGLAHGKGSAISIDGRYVIRNGRFENGHLVQGILIYPDGSVFSGSFRDGWLSNGQIVESDGRVYRGELLRQIPQGAGALSLEDGTRYEGGFDEGLFDGKGTLFYPFGAKYSGTFRNGLLHGNIEFSTEGIKERRRYEMGVLSGGRR